MKRGKFIVIEGTDGSGKATQTRLLASALRRRGKKVQTIEFPQHGQSSAAPVDAYLNGDFGTLKEVTPYQAAIFYAVDRAAARKRIGDWLKNGTTVIADRYIASTFAYGGAGLRTAKERKHLRDWAQNLEFGLFKIPRPDRTIFLDVPSRLSRRLVLMKKKRAYIQKGKRDLYEKDIRYQEKVRRAYTEYARRDRKVDRIECLVGGMLLSKKQVHAKILAALAGVV